MLLFWTAESHYISKTGSWSLFCFVGINSIPWLFFLEMSLNGRPVKGVLLDITGVLAESSSEGDGVAIQGSVQAVQKLRDNGKKILNKSTSSFNIVKSTNFESSHSVPICDQWNSEDQKVAGRQTPEAGIHSRGKRSVSIWPYPPI